MLNLYMNSFIILAIAASIQSSESVIDMKDIPIQYKPSRNHKRRKSKTKAPMAGLADQQDPSSIPPKIYIANRTPERTLQ